MDEIHQEENEGKDNDELVQYQGTNLNTITAAATTTTTTTTTKQVVKLIHDSSWIRTRNESTCSSDSSTIIRELSSVDYYDGGCGQEQKNQEQQITPRAGRGIVKEENIILPSQLLLKSEDLVAAENMMKQQQQQQQLTPRPISTVDPIPIMEVVDLKETFEDQVIVIEKSPIPPPLPPRTKAKRMTESPPATPAATSTPKVVADNLVEEDTNIKSILVDSLGYKPDSIIRVGEWKKSPPQEIIIPSTEEAISSSSIQIISPTSLSVWGKLKRITSINHEALASVLLRRRKSKENVLSTPSSPETTTTKSMSKPSPPLFGKSFKAFVSNIRTVGHIPKRDNTTSPPLNASSSSSSSLASSPLSQKTLVKDKTPANKNDTLAVYHHQDGFSTRIRRIRFENYFAKIGSRFNLIHQKENDRWSLNESRNRLEREARGGSNRFSALHRHRRGGRASHVKQSFKPIQKLREMGAGFRKRFFHDDEDNTLVVVNFQQHHKNWRKQKKTKLTKNNNNAHCDDFDTDDEFNVDHDSDDDDDDDDEEDNTAYNSRMYKYNHDEALMIARMEEDDNRESGIFNDMSWV